MILYASYLCIFIIFVSCIEFKIKMSKEDNSYLTLTKTGFPIIKIGAIEDAIIFTVKELSDRVVFLTNEAKPKALGLRENSELTLLPENDEVYQKFKLIKINNEESSYLIENDNKCFTADSDKMIYKRVCNYIDPSQAFEFKYLDEKDIKPNKEKETVKSDVQLNIVIKKPPRISIQSQNPPPAESDKVYETTKGKLNDLLAVIQNDVFDVRSNLQIIQGRKAKSVNGVNFKQ